MHITLKLKAFGAVAALMLSMAGFVANALAQQPPTRVRGTIERVDGSVLMVKSREGADLTIHLADNVNVAAIVKASLSDIKPGSFVGVAATGMPDGALRAVEVLIFPEAMRGTGEGHRPWDLLPESSMTNATVTEAVTRVEGPTFTLKYKDGEKKVVVPPEAPIVTYVPGERSELKAGAKIFIGAATRQADGTLQAARIGVGRGIDPPM